MSCIFCEIAQGTIPSEIVYEDDEVIAFNDISKAAKTHILVIPKTHIENLADHKAADVMPQITRAIQIIVKEQGLESDGFRVISNAGKGAGQSVFHLHFHILSGPEVTENIL